MQKIALMLTVVFTATVVITSCEQESDLVSQDFSSTPLLNSNRLGETTASNSLLKEELDKYAFEAYAGFFTIELSPSKSKLIDSETLSAWIKENEKNKNPEINHLNHKALAKMKNPVALLIQAPTGSPFLWSVFITDPLSSATLIITDIRVPEGEIQIVKRGFGFRGSINIGVRTVYCRCFEEYVPVSIGQTYSECGECNRQRRRFLGI